MLFSKHHVIGALLCCTTSFISAEIIVRWCIPKKESRECGGRKRKSPSSHSHTDGFHMGVFREKHLRILQLKCLVYIRISFTNLSNYWPVHSAQVSRMFTGWLVLRLVSHMSATYVLNNTAELIAGNQIFLFMYFSLWFKFLFKFLFMHLIKTFGLQSTFY